MSRQEEIRALLRAGDAAGAVMCCRAYWEEVGGPEPRPSGEDFLRDLHRRLTIWQQIDLYVGEVNRRPDNPRSWKLLGYAYMRAGIYLPALLRAAEHALCASLAREDEEGVAANLEEKIELCRRARTGEKEARAEIASAEAAFAESFTDFPPAVPLPEMFVRAGIVRKPEIAVTAAGLAPDLLELLRR